MSLFSVDCPLSVDTLLDIFISDITKIKLRSWILKTMNLNTSGLYKTANEDRISETTTKKINSKNLRLINDLEDSQFFEK